MKHNPPAEKVAIQSSVRMNHIS